MFEAIYTVIRIDGDYAILADSDGEQASVARALLPEDIAEGMRLLCKDFQYTIL